MAKFVVSKSPNEMLALTNCVIVNPADFKEPIKYLTVNGKFAFTLRRAPEMGKGQLGFSVMHRKWASFSLGEEVTVEPYDPFSETDILISRVTFEVDFLSRGKKVEETYDTADMATTFISNYQGQVYQLDMLGAFDFHGMTITFKVKDIEVVTSSVIKGDRAEDARPPPAFRGLLEKASAVAFIKAADSTIKLKGSAKMGAVNPIIQPNFKFEDLGIGGLDEEFQQIFRRAFASRIFPQQLIQKLGIPHVKGVLLYGPPGTGKTLMARQIGKMLNAKEPKIVNGPEILNKFVGQSEENIRALFKEAEAEYKAKGDDSDLHIIIFDELDAICKQRGSRNDGTGVGDSVVNQLLSKMDGVEVLNNVLIIGMTNRKDMIDEALLRPGRFEVQVEINLPDRKGRQQILKIHTNNMRVNKYLGDDVDLDELSELTKNFSGAEIQGLVKSAASFAMNRHIKGGTMAKVDGSLDNYRVIRDDFLHALQEVTPAFGVSDDEFASCITNGIIEFAPSVKETMESLHLFVKQVQNSARTPLVSLLLHGPSGSGKTALAAQLAKESGYPFVKLITPESMVGMSEMQKCNAISRVFENSYKSTLSLIVVDSIERLLEWVPIGPRFSNAVLQTLMVLLKKNPPPGRRLLIICTSSQKSVLQQMDMADAFNSDLYIPNIHNAEAVLLVLQQFKLFTDAELKGLRDKIPARVSIGIKKLAMIIETARQAEEHKVDKFVTLLQQACEENLSY